VLLSSLLAAVGCEATSDDSRLSTDTKEHSRRIDN